MIDSYTIRSADCIHAPVSSTDCVFVFVIAAEVNLEFMEYINRFLWQSILLHQWQHSNFVRSQCWWNRKHHPLASFFSFSASNLFFFVRIRQNRKEHTIQSYRSLHHKWNITLIALAIEILKLLTRMFLVTFQIKIRSAMNSFQFFKAHREIKLNVARSVGILRYVQ